MGFKFGATTGTPDDEAVGEGEGDAFVAVGEGATEGTIGSGPKVWSGMGTEVTEGDEDVVGAAVGLASPLGDMLETTARTIPPMTATASSPARIIFFTFIFST